MRQEDRDKKHTMKKLAAHLFKMKQKRHPQFRWSQKRGWEVLAYVCQHGTPSEAGYYFEAHIVQGRPVKDIREENSLIAKTQKEFAYSQNGFDYYWAVYN